LSEVTIYFFSLYVFSDDGGQAVMKPDNMVPEAPRELLPLITSSNMKLDKKKELVTLQLRNTVSDLSLAADDLIIPWNELVLKEKIGAGTRKFSLF
jgi:serine/threonine-protein kinase CTR1